jgi:hypothetical protein
MALAFSLVDTWDDGKRIHVSGTIAATGSYATGGDTVDLSQVPVIASTQPPIQGTAWMDGLAGYDYVFIPGAAMNSNKVKMFASAGAAQAAFPELTAGGVPQRDYWRHDHVLRDFQEAAVVSGGCRYSFLLGNIQ